MEHLNFQVQVEIGKLLMKLLLQLLYNSKTASLVVPLVLKCYLESRELGN